jgi:hypothetical protein
MSIKLSDIAKVVITILMIIGATQAWCLSGDEPAAPDLHACNYSDQVFNNDRLILQHEAPTRFRLMPSRYVGILQALRGYNCVGTSTVAFNGHAYSQAGMSDDPGISELIPTISSRTGMTIANSFDVTVFVVVFLGIVVGYLGFCRIYADQRSRLVGAIFFVSIGLLEAGVANVHIFQSSPLVAGVPWLLYFAFTQRAAALTLSAALLAFCCSWCSLVRIGTSLICLSFVVTLIVVRSRMRQTVLPLFLISLACVPSLLFERSLIIHRNTILASLGQRVTVENSHTIWHSIYIGLAFIHNADVPEYNDTIGMKRVQLIDPTVPYMSTKYDDILRHEVLSLAKHRPLLLMENLVVKTGIMIFLMLVFLFPSRRVIFSDERVFWMDAAFLVAILTSAMNAILVIPRIPYLLTFLCLTLLYSCVRLCSDPSDELRIRRLAEASAWYGVRNE